MVSVQLKYPVRNTRTLVPYPTSWPVHVQKSSTARASDRPSESSSDERLINAAIGGDEKAFRYLVERYQHHVTRTVTGMLGKVQIVDDCVQDVFIRLYASLVRYRGEASIKTYITRIAINRSLDAIRKEKRSLFVPWETTETESVESDSAGPEADLISADQRRQLRTALDSLPPKHRSVVVLRLIDGMSTAETAGVLGVPYGTVLSRLTRALGKLKLVLGEGSRPANAGLKATDDIVKHRSA